MNIVFNTGNGFDYHWSGRFIAPNGNWIHMTRELTDFELVLVTEGELHIECDGTEYTVLSGEYLLMPPAGIQKGTKQGYCSFYWVHFNNNNYTLQKDTTDIIGDEEIRIKQQAVCKSKERLIILLKELQDSDKRYRDSKLNNYLTGALLTELSLQSMEISNNRFSRSKEQLNSDIKTFISWHISEMIRINEIAAYFEYNEKYLTTFFKKMNGVPLKRYILREKMEYAKSILTESNTTVSEVAYSIGFSDVHNFSNAFKEVTGMAPGVYRKQFDKHSIFDR
ncbi:MAG: helix-turn-helix domain-containing protein [Lachnospiraceae bacterium]|nr:helix-turn-helix domain-containing protein [Lachnospiraceae bacterium]